MAKKGAILLTALLTVTACSGRPAAAPQATPGAKLTGSAAVVAAQRSTLRAPSERRTTTIRTSQSLARSESKSRPATMLLAEGYSPPTSGAYVYRLEGTQPDQYNPAGTPHRYSDATLTRTVSRRGSVVTIEQTTSTQATKQVKRIRWQRDGVFLLFVSAETFDGTYSCRFAPPIRILAFPMRAQALPTQKFHGEGELCVGKLDTLVEGRETITDATGKSWTAWRIKTRNQTYGKYPQTTHTTAWLAPSTWMDVRSDATSDVAFGTQHYKSTSRASLRSHP